MRRELHIPPTKGRDFIYTVQGKFEMDFWKNFKLVFWGNAP